MKKIILNIAFLILISFTSCLPDHSAEYLRNVDYDKSSSTLRVNYQENPDTSLQQIIILSDIRKEGYGVLLNIDRSVSQAQLDSIKYKFKKQDINAVHSFNWNTGDALPKIIHVALEGSRFNWIFSKQDMIHNDSLFADIKKAIETSITKGGIYVINSTKAADN